ncbi:hypothetical protein IFR05_001837 [Cadophora sp. M221]|nr:hypothetical protein IFR05_001837 [Cadophora sp. M221]
MGVPFEALLPYGIMLAMFGVTGAGLSKLRHMQNGGKRGRHSVDQWDRQSNYHGYLESRVGLLMRDSDGSRSQIDWILERTNRQPSSSTRFRVEQPMEARETDYLG